jgi:hypothetical protein
MEPEKKEVSDKSNPATNPNYGKGKAGKEKKPKEKKDPAAAPAKKAEAAKKTSEDDLDPSVRANSDCIFFSLELVIAKIPFCLQKNFPGTLMPIVVGYQWHDSVMLVHTRALCHFHTYGTLLRPSGVDSCSHSAEPSQLVFDP